MRPILSLQFKGFMLAGGLATLFHWSLMAVLVYFGLEATFATVIGSVSGAALNYVLQRRLAFPNAGSHYSTIWRYMNSCLLAWLCNVAFFYFLNSTFLLPVSLSQVIATGLVATLNYVVYQRIVFHDKTI